MGCQGSWRRNPRTGEFARHQHRTASPSSSVQRGLKPTSPRSRPISGTSTAGSPGGAGRAPSLRSSGRPMSRARRSRRSAMAIRSPEPTLTGPCTELCEQRRKRGPDVLDVQEAADLPAVRAARLAPREQIHDHRGHQSLRDARRDRTGRISAPGGRQPMRAPVLGERCHGDLARGVSRRALPARSRAGSSARCTRHARPIVFGAAPRHHGAHAAAAPKRGEQMPGRAQPAIVLLAVPVQTRRRDPGEVQQVRRRHRLEERIDDGGVGEVGVLHVDIGQRATRAIALVRARSKGRRRPRSPPRAAARGWSGR